MFAKTKDGWRVKGKDGWIDEAGKLVPVIASQKRVRMYDNEADARANGFRPSAVQTTLAMPKASPTK